MHRKLALVCIGLFCLNSSHAVAQPIPHEVHGWYIQTDSGLIGYRDVQIDPGQWHMRTIELGRAGQVLLTRPIIATAAVSLLIAFTALFVLVLAWSRRRRVAVDLGSNNSTKSTT